jgi:hypothetical protein
MRRAAASLMLLLLLPLVSGCGESVVDSDAAQRGRQRVEQRIARVLAPAREQGLPVRAAGVQDGCYAGQDNYEIHDPYRTKCQRYRSVVLGLGPGDHAQADALARRIVQVLCPPVRAGLVREYGPQGTAVASLTCDGLYVDVTVVPAVPVEHGELESLSFDPQGANYEFRAVDPSRTVQVAARAGDGFLLIVRAGGEYYTVPR